MSLRKLVPLAVLAVALAPVAMAGSKGAGDAKSVLRSGSFDQARDDARSILRSGSFGEAGDEMGSILRSGSFDEARDQMGSVLHSGSFDEAKDEMGSILPSGKPGEAADSMKGLSAHEQNLILSVNGRAKQLDVREGQALEVSIYVKQWKSNTTPPRTTQRWLLIIDLDGVRAVVEVASPSASLRVPQLAGRTLRLSAITEYGPSANEVEVDIHSLDSSGGSFSAN